MNARVLARLVALSLTVSLLVLGVPAIADHGPSEKTSTTVPSVGGHGVPITVYRPLAADTENRVPVLLHSHGWSGSRATADDAFHNYTAAGFGVVSIDMRGHGAARQTSEARVHHMDFEIEDVRAVIDYVAGLDWVLLDAIGDPRLGSLGGSYGGGYQLLTAAVDPRLDALVPEITWNNLPESVAPGGAPKSAWLDVLYGAGNALARVHPDVHRGFAYVQATNEFPDGSLPGEPDLLTQFTSSSPASYPTAVDEPTLLIQGMPDTLFNFNQAAANYAQIKATGAPVRLVTHLTGHILNTDGTLGGAPIGIGLQPPKGPTPCGVPETLAIAWLQKHLLGSAVATGPQVCIALDDGSTATGPDFPLPGTTMTAFPIAGTTLLPQTPGIRVEFPLFTAEEATTIVGIPHLSGSVAPSGSEGIVYWYLLTDKLSEAPAIADSQVTPLRVAASSPFELDLGGVGLRLDPGDSLVLVAASSNEQFAHNGGRTPGVTTLSGLELELPILA